MSTARSSSAREADRPEFLPPSLAGILIRRMRADDCSQRRRTPRDSPRREQVLGGPADARHRRVPRSVEAVPAIGHCHNGRSRPSRPTCRQAPSRRPDRRQTKVPGPTCTSALKWTNPAAFSERVRTKCSPRRVADGRGRRGQRGSLPQDKTKTTWPFFCLAGCRSTSRSTQARAPVLSASDAISRRSSDRTCLPG
jgi:hypothetical protein